MLEEEGKEEEMARADEGGDKEVQAMMEEKTRGGKCQFLSC